MKSLLIKSMFVLLISYILVYAFPYSATASIVEGQEKVTLNEGWMLYTGESPKDGRTFPFQASDKTGPVNWVSIDNLNNLDNVAKDTTPSWLKVILPHKNLENPCIYFELIYGQSLEVYLDSNKIIERVRPLWPCTNVANIEIVPLPRDYQGKPLFIRVIPGEMLNSVGPRPNVYIGESSKLLPIYADAKFNELIFSIIMGSILIFLGVMILFFSLFFEKSQRKSWKSIGLLSLTFGFFAALNSDKLYLILGDKELYALIFYDIIKFVFLSILSNMLIKILGEKYRMSILRKILVTQNVYALVCFILLILNLASGYKYMLLYRILSYDILGVIYLISFIIYGVIIIAYALKKDAEAKTILYGLLSFVLFTLIDFAIFFIFNPRHSMVLCNWGLLGFIISVIIVLAKRISLDHARVIQYSEELVNLNQTLEQRVLERTVELEKSNQILSDTNEEMYATNEELVSTLAQLNETHEQLIQAEKMAALGHLVAGIAHEINTPMGAIKASINNVSQYFINWMDDSKKLFKILSEEEQSMFYDLVLQAIENKESLSSREERALKKSLIQRLNELQIKNSSEIADMLIDMGISSNVDKYISLLEAHDNLFIVNSAYTLSGIQRNSKNISLCTDKVSKMVFALKSYTHYDDKKEFVSANIISGIETVLTLYQNKLKQGVVLERTYEDIPEILCNPDELSQVWTNIIHNALQAMDYKGRLEIKVFAEEGFIAAQFTDSGTGIADEIKHKIFNPFFTTKPQGEGTGLGLDIVKKIVDRHNGNIHFESVPGCTSFKVLLPI
ncbi:MAG: ATP-binding protein [Clostridia bacterium]|nr:ATP-binding protein [Clostridia bacterium]